MSLSLGGWHWRCAETGGDLDGFKKGASPHTSPKECGNDIIITILIFRMNNAFRKHAVRFEIYIYIYMYMFYI